MEIEGALRVDHHSAQEFPATNGTTSWGDEGSMNRTTGTLEDDSDQSLFAPMNLSYIACTPGAELAAEIKFYGAWQLRVKAAGNLLIFYTDCSSANVWPFLKR